MTTPPQWPNREEWAKIQGTPDYNELASLQWDQRLSTHASAPEIAELLTALTTLWKKEGVRLRALLVPSELKRQRRESSAAYYQRQQTMSAAEQQLLQAALDCRYRRGDINFVIKELRGNSTYLLSDLKNYVPEETAKLIDLIEARCQATHDAAKAQLAAACLTRPIDDAAWAKELQRREEELQRRKEEHAEYVKLRESIGVSFLLPLIRPRVRNRLARQHGIDVDELQKESTLLSIGLAQFDSRQPAETEADFQARALLYNQKLVTHHRRVKAVGEVLGGLLGKTLIAMADLAIDWLLTSEKEARGSIVSKM